MSACVKLARVASVSCLAAMRRAAVVVVESSPAAPAASVVDGDDGTRNASHAATMDHTNMLKEIDEFERYHDYREEAAEDALFAAVGNRHTAHDYMAYGYVMDGHTFIGSGVSSAVFLVYNRLLSVHCVMKVTPSNAGNTLGEMLIERHVRKRAPPHVAARLPLTHHVMVMSRAECYTQCMWPMYEMLMNAPRALTRMMKDRAAKEAPDGGGGGLASCWPRNPRRSLCRAFDDATYVVVHTVRYAGRHTLSQFFNLTSGRADAKQLYTRLFVQLLETLACMHEAGATHNDLHVNNVTVECATDNAADAVASIIDLGLATLTPSCADAGDWRTSCFEAENLPIYASAPNLFHLPPERRVINAVRSQLLAARETAFSARRERNNVAAHVTPRKRPVRSVAPLYTSLHSAVDLPDFVGVEFDVDVVMPLMPEALRAADVYTLAFCFADLRRVDDGACDAVAVVTRDVVSGMLCRDYRKRPTARDAYERMRRALAA